MGNVRFVQKVFLTRPTVKHTRSLTDTDKYVRRVYVRDETDRPIRDQDVRLRKILWPRPGLGLGQTRSLKTTDFDRLHASVCWRSVQKNTILPPLHYLTCRQNSVVLEKREWLDELPEGSKGFTIGLTIYTRFRRVNCSEWHCKGRRVRKKQWAIGHVNLYLRA